MAPRPKTSVEIRLDVGQHAVTRRAHHVGVSSLAQELRTNMGQHTRFFVYDGGRLCGVYFPLDGRVWSNAESGKLAACRLEIDAWYVAQELREELHLIAFDPPRPQRAGKRKK